MKIRWLITYPAVCAAIVGCAGPLVPVTETEELQLETRRKVLALPVYNEYQLSDKQYQILNIVEGVSCKNKTWNHTATRSDAIYQAKYWAYEIGADGLLNIQCEQPGDTTTTYDCREGIVCTAQAIKLLRK
jgi:hypothetical protein